MACNRRCCVISTRQAPIRRRASGPRHNPLTHLIPLVLRAAAGVNPDVKVFGRDYPTPDGTAIRDYIHVVDLCEAHLAAIDYLMQGGETRAFNLGVGRGFSVQEVIDSAKRVTGRDFKVIDAGAPARRSGAPRLRSVVRESGARLEGALRGAR